MHRKPAILLVGPTGAGKSPLGDELERTGLWGMRCGHFDFGRHLRRIVAGDDRPEFLSADHVAFLRSVLEAGALLEDEHFRIAEDILRAFIARKCAGDDVFVLLDGLPRHVGQAADVDAVADVRAVISLNCSPEAVLERIVSNAGGDRAGRSDDAVHAVEAKLEVFARRTAPLIEHYREMRVKVVTVDVGPETTPADILAKLDAAE